MCLIEFEKYNLEFLFIRQDKHKFLGIFSFMG